MFSALSDHTRCGLFVPALLILSIRMVDAQQGTADSTLATQSDTFLRQGTEVYASTGALIFEARLGEPLRVTRRADRVFDFTDQSRRHRVGWWALNHVRPDSVVIVPEVSIRMLQAPSDPIPTPSFHPRLASQWLSTQDPDHFRALTAGESTWLRVNEVHVLLAHHSNGQDGCYYIDQKRVANDCVPDASQSSQEINTVNGSFATNYWQFGATWKWVRLPPADNSGIARANREWLVGSDFEWHVSMGDPDIFRNYGRARLATRLGFSRSAYGRLALSAEGVLVRKPERPFAWTFQASYFFHRWKEWGIFVRSYQGQDYYNIEFKNWTQRWHVGLIHSRDGFLQFRSSKASSQ